MNLDLSRNSNFSNQLDKIIYMKITPFWGKKLLIYLSPSMCWQTLEYFKNVSQILTGLSILSLMFQDSLGTKEKPKKEKNDENHKINAESIVNESFIFRTYNCRACPRSLSWKDSWRNYPIKDKV